MPLTYHDLIEGNFCVQKYVPGIGAMASSTLEDYYSETAFEIFHSFAFFFWRKRDLAPEVLESLDTTWKAHISIHPEDLPKAWDQVIWNKLSEEGVAFKVLDTSGLSLNKLEAEEEIQEAEEELSALIKSYHAYSQDREDKDVPEDLYWQINNVYAAANRLEIITGDEDSEIEKTEDPKEKIRRQYEVALLVYKKHIAGKKDSLKLIERMEVGMQVTLYIPPGQESHCQTILEQV